MIQINLTVDEARLKVCQAIRARKIAMAGVRENNIAAVAFGFGWLDKILVEIQMAAPPEVSQNPDGSPLDGTETPKP